MISDCMDTSLNKLVVKRLWGLIGKVLNMKSLNMDNIRELLIFIRYNKGIVVIQKNIHIFKMHIRIFRENMSVITFLSLILLIIKGRK